MDLAFLQCREGGFCKPQAAFQECPESPKQPPALVCHTIVERDLGMGASGAVPHHTEGPCARLLAAVHICSVSRKPNNAYIILLQVVTTGQLFAARDTMTKNSGADSLAHTTGAHR